jgi:L-asparaginase II
VERHQRDEVALAGERVLLGVERDLLQEARQRGLGGALKIEDGNRRALGPATAAFLALLGYPVEKLERGPVENNRGENVGDIRAE